MPKLEEAYPSSPGRPPRYSLYVERAGDDDTQMIVQTFCAPYAARKFLDVLLADDEIEWVGKNKIQSSSGIVVYTLGPRAEKLREVVEHEYSLPEMGWSLTGPYLVQARLFRAGPNQPRT